ncbi:hypothetical protein FXF51_05855 [Nonomuraea sp. PA05]|uniref:hypothetical protein n=1 Tax=Nonomuraea sp. PA05 TaxID=2604466 RepID=UPI0011DAB3B4|nr:hypothetical protein [Nonomuraea sp. PA05]TYB69684.1 hypothetical protein FXF51_05855 [Nonomuraea sp. PA05]
MSTETALSVEAEVRAAAVKIRTDKGHPNGELVAELLDHLAFEMECEDAEEQDFPEHVPQWRRMVVDHRGEGSFAWTTALVLARVVNGTGQEVASR